MNEPEPDRRTFLHQSGAVATAAAVGALASTRTATADDDQPSRANRGRIYKAIKGGGRPNQAAYAKQFKAIAELGFDGIEGVSPGVSNPQALLAALDETNFPVHGVVDMVHWKDRLSSPNAEVRARGLAALEQALRDAHSFGGSSVLLVPGRVTGSEESHDHVWKRSIAQIRQALPLAAKLGIRILIENVWNGFCETPEQLRDYIDEIGSPWVGVYFDIGNVRKFGPSEDWIRLLGTRIVKLDVKDWGQKNGFCPLGEGDVNWPEVCAALAEVNFTGWATREGSDGSLAETAKRMDALLKL
jgi:hexulose-6-phosphate isomerase